MAAAGVVRGERGTLTLSRTGAGRLDAEVWCPAGVPADQPLPMLISHDGQEMDAYGRLTAYAGAMIADGTLPPMRVALVSPGPGATSGTPPTRRTPAHSRRG